MGKKETCASCKQEYEDTKKQKMQRRIVNTLLGQIKTELPGIEETLEQSKDFCFKCYQKTILQGVGPTIKGLLGQVEEAEEEKKDASC